MPASPHLAQRDSTITVKSDQAAGRPVANQESRRGFLAHAPRRVAHTLLQVVHASPARPDAGPRQQPADTRSGSGPAWAPTLHVLERSDADLVAVELPGVHPDDLELAVEDGLLTGQGERRSVTLPTMS